MTHDRAKLFVLAACLASAATACDQAPEQGSESRFRSLGGVGSGTGLTLNTNQWVSSAARDVYEFNLNGAWHTNSFGYSSKYTTISLASSPYGPVTTQVGAPAPAGKPRAVVVPGDDFAVNVLGPSAGDPVHRLDGPALIGLKLRFTVRGYDDVEHPVVLEVIDHLADPEAGDFYAIIKVDPVTGEMIAPLCEEDAGGYRLARIYDGLSVHGESGEMAYVGQGVHHVACSSSAPAKAALFGYNPTEVTVETFTLVNRVVRADYCADGNPYTYPGNLVGIEDDFSAGQEDKTIADVYAALGEDEAVEAVWDVNGVMCIDSPRASNVSREDVVCPIKRHPNGAVSYNWRPPSCEGFVDAHAGSGVRFFSKSSL